VRWYERLRRQADIAYVRRRGRRTNTPTLAAYTLELPLASASRIGITVSKAVGKAVTRNLVRRRIQGALDAMGPLVPARTGLLFVARPEAAVVPYAQLAADVARAVSSAAAPRSRNG
jgi:ribonuclease P protein component